MSGVSLAVRTASASVQKPAGLKLTSLLRLRRLLSTGTIDGQCRPAPDLPCSNARDNRTHLSDVRLLCAWCSTGHGARHWPTPTSGLEMTQRAPTPRGFAISCGDVTASSVKRITACFVGCFQVDNQDCLSGTGCGFLPTGERGDEVTGSLIDSPAGPVAQRCVAS